MQTEIFPMKVDPAVTDEKLRAGKCFHLVGTDINFFTNVSQRIDDLVIVVEGEIVSEPSSWLAQKVIAKLAWHMYQIEIQWRKK